MARRRNLAGVVEDARAAWDEKVAEFREQAEATDRAEAALLEAYPLAEQTGGLDRWQAEYDKLDSLRNTIATVQNGIRSAGDWWVGLQSTQGGSSSWGSDLFDIFNPGARAKEKAALSGLGVVPAVAFPVGLGVIAGAIAAMAAVVASVYSAIQYWKERAVAQLIANGVDPLDARAQIDGQYPTEAGRPLADNIAQTAMWAALAVGAFVFYKSRKR